MTIHHPAVKEQIVAWQNELRKATNDKVVLVAFDPGDVIPFEVLKHIVCKVTGVPFRSAISKSRKAENVMTKQLISYFARRDYDLILKDIAQRLGWKDHTTAISAARRIHDLLCANDEKVCRALEKIYKEIEAYKLQNQ
jgi:chromosomal replication initiation ATPase DnaA